MRRAVAIAALALVALPAAAAAAPARRSFALPEEVVGRPALAGDALYYVVRTRRVTTVKRIDLNTLQVVPVYSKPLRSWGLGPLRAGGGRVAVELDDVNPRGGLATQVVDLTGPPRVVARGLVRAARRKSCGTEVALEDVSPEGEVLVDEARTRRPACAGARHTLRRYGAGPPAVIRRYSERRSDEMRQRRSVAGRLLEATESTVTLSGRRIHRAPRGFEVSWADLDAGSDVALGEIRARGSSIRGVVRLLTPAGTRVLLDAAGAQAEPRFCGSRLVIQAVSRQLQQLLVYDDLAAPPRTAFSAPRSRRDLDIQLACDADTAVLVDAQAPRRSAIEVLPLAP